MVDRGTINILFMKSETNRSICHVWRDWNHQLNSFLNSHIALPLYLPKSFEWPKEKYIWTLDTGCAFRSSARRKQWKKRFATFLSNVSGHSEIDAERNCFRNYRRVIRKIVDSTLNLKDFLTLIFRKRSRGTKRVSLASVTKMLQMACIKTREEN